MKEDIQEKNKLIAEFMGLTYHESTDEWTYIHPEDGQSVIWSEGSPPYHTSWGWLMPVVEKISKVWWSDFKNGWDDVDEAELEIQKYKVTALSLDTPIKEAWQAVIQFIQWHNENK